MNPWKLIIEQVESGYAAYRYRLQWNSPDPCPHDSPTRSDGRWYGSWADAGTAGERDRIAAAEDRIAEIYEEEYRENVRTNYGLPTPQVTRLPIPPLPTPQAVREL
jgi:hypothetical protein